MSVSIVWVIAVILLIAKSVSNAKKGSSSKPKPNVPRQYSQSAQPKGNPWEAYQQPKKRQPQPERKKQKSSSAQPRQLNEILEKAKENSNYSRIREEQVHDLHGSDHTIGHDTELANVPGVDDFDTYHLMEEVNDLIVKGYDGNLVFERDFLAEATDMLNKMVEMP
jgi:hypothetical protein